MTENVHHFGDDMYNIDHEDGDAAHRKAKVIEAVRASFRDGDLVLIQWNDPRTLTRAPWDMWCGELIDCVGTSVGFIHDQPEYGVVMLQPHLAKIPFDDDNDWELGGVWIPYTSIKTIRRLLSTCEVLNPNVRAQKLTF